MGFRLVGKLTQCNSCSLIKANHKSITKVSDLSKKSSDAGERLFVNIDGTFKLTETCFFKAMKN